MPDPHATLSIFAEVSVALAGFSGIVIAFGRRSLGALTQLELRRLANLFVFSGSVLLLALLGMSLLHLVPADSSSLWRSASALVFVFGTFWMIMDARRVSRLAPTERADVKGYILYPFMAAGVAALVLQLVNVLLFHEAWPFFLALVLAIAFALQQFILLVRMAFRDAPDR